MQKTLSVLVISALTLSACSGWRDSRVNPSNWFGSSTPAPVETTSENDANALVPAAKRTARAFLRGLKKKTRAFRLPKLTSCGSTQRPAGAIVYASGTAIRQGAYNARLVRVRSEENEKNGVLEYTFRVNYPTYQTPQGSERTRMVSDAVNISAQDLESSIRLVRVVGQQNALESRRR